MNGTIPWLLCEKNVYFQWCCSGVVWTEWGMGSCASLLLAILGVVPSSNPFLLLPIAPLYRLTALPRSASAACWCHQPCQHVSPEEASGWAEQHGPLSAPCQLSPGAGAHRRAAVTPPLSAGSFLHVGICTPDFSSVWWGFCSLCEHWWEAGTQRTGRQQVWRRAFHKREQGKKQRRVGARVKSRAKERSCWSAGLCPPHQHILFTCVVNDPAELLWWRCFRWLSTLLNCCPC